MKSDKLVLRESPDVEAIDSARRRRFLKLSPRERLEEAFIFNVQLAKMFPQANKKPSKNGLFINHKQR